MDDLRLGIIGAGARHSITIPAHRPGKGSRIVAAADTNPAALEAARAHFGSGLATTADYREVLARTDVDAVFVVTPDFLHEEQAVAALEAGKDVFCEKPMAITIAGCDRMLATAQRTGRKLFIGHNMRYMDFTRQMKEIIDRGDIGEVKAVWVRHFISYGGDAYFKDWHSERKHSTGLLLQKGAHDLDIIHWLAGAPSRRVSAFGSLSVYDQAAKRTAEDGPYVRGFVPENWPPLAQRGMSPVIDVEDQSVVNMILANGVIATYQQCHFTPDACRNYTVIGTKGRLENYGDFGNECTINVWTRRSDGFHRPDAVYSMPSRVGGHGGADTRISLEFVEFVRNGGRTYASAVAARDSVAVGCQATASLRSGGMPLDVPAVDPHLAAYFHQD